MQFTLTDDAKVKIVIKKKKGGAVVSINYGRLRSGTHTKNLIAPGRRGDYILEVIANQSCGSQTVTSPLKVR